MRERARDRPGGWCGNLRRCRRRRKRAPGVADHPGEVEVKVEIGGGLEEHAGLGFTPVVVGAEFGDGGFGMVGAIVGRIYICTGFFLELAADFIVDGFDVGFGEHAAGDAGLVGDDDEAVAERTESGECGGGTGEEADFCRVTEVPIVVDEGVVAIEEYRTLGHERGVPWLDGRSLQG